MSFFDSNVWISGFHFGATPLAALHRAYRRHHIAICDAIRTEVSTALVQKFRWSEKRLSDAFADYSDDMFSVLVPEHCMASAAILAMTW